MLFLVPFVCCDADGGMWPFWNYEQSGVSQLGVGTPTLFSKTFFKPFLNGY